MSKKKYPKPKWIHVEPEPASMEEAGIGNPDNCTGAKLVHTIPASTQEIIADYERCIKALEERVKELEAILELDMPKEPLDGESWRNPIQKYSDPKLLNKPSNDQQ